MQQDYDIQVEWRGIEIHPEIPPEGLAWPPYLRARFGGMSDMLREEARRAGLNMVVPEIIPKSRRALEAAEYVREQGRHDAFHKLVFYKFYGQGQNLNDWSVLQAAAADVGVDASAMQRQTESGQYAPIIDRRGAELRALGATGVPLYIFDAKYAVIGLQPYDAFQEVMEHIQADNEQ